MPGKISFTLLLVFSILAGKAARSQTAQRSLRTEEHKALQANLCKGWNTWYNNSVLSHVLLPQGFSINLCVGTKDNKAYLKEAFKASAILHRPENVLLGLRSDDGSYTSLKLTYMGLDLSVESATDGDDELILISPAKPSDNFLIAEAGLLWDGEGEIGRAHDQLLGKFKDKNITLSATATPVSDPYTGTTAPRLTFVLNEDIGLYTGKA